jgi:hypothetical protein
MLVFIADQPVKSLVCLAPFEWWFVLDHFVGDMVDGRRIDVGGHTRIVQSTDCRTNLRFKCDLAEPVVRAGASGFCVEVDEHSKFSLRLSEPLAEYWCNWGYQQ